jgi:hypothetical protein
MMTCMYVVYTTLRFKKNVDVRESIHPSIPMNYDIYIDIECTLSYYNNTKDTNKKTTNRKNNHRDINQWHLTNYSSSSFEETSSPPPPRS